jgi:hypothetical protein
MIKKLFLLFIILVIYKVSCPAQSFVRTADLFRPPANNSNGGRLNISQDPSIDTLISRSLMVSENINRVYSHYGMKGFRIQIYSSSNRNARKESDIARLQFMSKFSGIVTYQVYAEPGYFKIRAGDFRTKTEATRLFLMVSKEFPDAYLVPDIINFPDLNTK